MNALIRSTLVWVGAFIFSAVLALSGFKNFSAWPQVLDLWDLDLPLEYLTEHPHFFRYLVVYPGFMLENYFGNYGFSIYLCIFFATNIVLWRLLINKYCGRNPNVIIWILFLGVHLAMNGRGVIAWCAWLICMHVCLDLSDVNRNTLFPIFRIVFSSFLGTVSTGVFVVIVFAILFFVFRWLRAKKKKHNIFLSLFVLFLSIPFFIGIYDYFVAAVSKNVDFYGGGLYGFFGMFQHGLGMIFFFFEDINYAYLSLWCLALLPVITFLFAFLFVRLRTSWSAFGVLQMIPIAGGLFGFTVLTLAIPLLLGRGMLFFSLRRGKSLALIKN